MPKSRSANQRPKANPASSWPTGITYEDVFDYERSLREKVEEELARRIRALEDRLLIVEQYDSFEEQYPGLKEAYDKFREEEAKMQTFETLKKDNGDQS